MSKNKALTKQAELIQKLNKKPSSPLQGVSFISPKKAVSRTSAVQSIPITNFFSRITEDKPSTEPMEVDTPKSLDIEEPKKETNEISTKSVTSNPVSRSLESFALSNSPMKKIKTAPSAPQSPSRVPKEVNSKFDFAKNPMDFNGNRPGDPGYNPTELYISDQDWKSMTAAKKQYWEYKQKHFDEIVFFQQGDFFNLFGPDAYVGIEKFGLTYNKNLDSVGFNRKQVRDWAAKFCSLGYKISIFEQSTTAVTEEEKNLKKKKKGTEDRNVTNKLTAGTIDDYQMFDENDYSSRYLLCIQESVIRDAHTFGISLIDTSTYEWRITSFGDDDRLSQFETLLLQTRPAEILYDRSTLSAKTKKLIDVNMPNICMSFVKFPDELESWNLISDGGYFSNDIPQVIKDIKSDVHALTSLGGTITYFQTLSRTSIEATDGRSMNSLDKEIVPRASYAFFNIFDQQEFMIMDASTLVNLEILENNENGTTQGTLFELLNHCVTPYGKRMLRRWICYPLLRADRIRERQEVVKFFSENCFIMDSIRSTLKRSKDIERLLTRMLSGNISISLFLEFLDTMTLFEELIRTEKQSISQEDIKVPHLLDTLFYQLPDLKPFLDKYLFNRAETKETGLIKPFPGTNTLYDEALSNIATIESSLDQTLMNIKRKYSIAAEYHHSKTEMYSIKVKTSNNVPSDWVKIAENKQGFRYNCPEVTSLVQDLVAAKAKLELICSGLLTEYLQVFKKDFTLCSMVIRNIAQLDVLMSFACNFNDKSSACSMCLPEFVDREETHISVEEMTHPYIKTSNGMFIPNDIHLGDTESKILLITGPNMGGKSTLLRQVCIVSVLAQIGCYVPARKCVLTPVDRIFTRLGARDNIIAGKSTFLIEIEETSKILKHSTNKSLIILDELGRGTSTFDGYSIAYAVLKYLESRQSIVLFSTHYHKLTQEFNSKDGHVQQYHMGCHEVNGEMVFLYKLTEGPCPNSFGLNVAAMANIPKNVLLRAEQMSSQFESIVKNRGILKRNEKLRLVKDICMKLQKLMK